MQLLTDLVQYLACLKFRFVNQKYLYLHTGKFTIHCWSGTSNIVMEERKTARYSPCKNQRFSITVSYSEWLHSWCVDVQTEDHERHACDATVSIMVDIQTMHT